MSRTLFSGVVPKTPFDNLSFLLFSASDSQKRKLQTLQGYTESWCHLVSISYLSAVYQGVIFRRASPAYICGALTPVTSPDRIALH
eukprot:scaffold211837_cov79-Attheya_sp.AAC.3